MKITDVAATWIRVPIPKAQQHTSDFGRAETFDTAIVQIDTDAGVTGWGEAKIAAGSSGHYAGLVALINEEMAPILRGENPLGINRIWEVLYNGSRARFALDRGHVFPAMARRGISIAAMSGVDIALWDILGKSLGAPLHQLLGGKRVDRMPAYASGGWAAADGIPSAVKGPMRSWAMAGSATAPSEVEHSVMPSWQAASMRVTFSRAHSTVFAGFDPASARGSMRERRADMIANSAPTKKALRARRTAPIVSAAPALTVLPPGPGHGRGSRRLCGRPASRR